MGGPKSGERSAIASAPTPSSMATVVVDTVDCDVTVTKERAVRNTLANRGAGEHGQQGETICE
jgi:hypothetical protein